MYVIFILLLYDIKIGNRKYTDLHVIEYQQHLYKSLNTIFNLVQQLSINSAD